MTDEGTLFHLEPRYCIDTNVIVSFLSESDDEYYGADIFAEQWHQIERLIIGSEIIAPRQVQRELEGHARKTPTIAPWLRNHHHMFRDIVSDQQLALAKQIVNAYPTYGKNTNYLGDLEVMSLAGALHITVISLEAPMQQSGQRRPKIPNVCNEFGIACLSVAGFLRAVLRTDTDA